MADKTTIFLSHSSKDIEKVRKIRDILELLEYEPLMFHLRCLDDDNEKLEDFIQKEIDARNIFIYCKSANSEKSLWVQKELQYIRQLVYKRTYEINIERPFNETLIELLQSIATILRKNRVFISCSHKEPDRQLGEQLKSFLQENDFDVFIHQYFNIEKDYTHKKIYSVLWKTAYLFRLSLTNT